MVSQESKENACVETFLLTFMKSIVTMILLKKISDKMEDEKIEGCISCMKTRYLCNLFAVSSQNVLSYATMFETCFKVKIPSVFKFICIHCVKKLEDASALLEQTTKCISMFQDVDAWKKSRSEAECLNQSLLEDTCQNLTLEQEPREPNSTIVDIFQGASGMPLGQQEHASLVITNIQEPLTETDGHLAIDLVTHVGSEGMEVSLLDEMENEFPLTLMKEPRKEDVDASVRNTSVNKIEDDVSLMNAPQETDNVDVSLQELIGDVSTCVTCKAPSGSSGDLSQHTCTTHRLDPTEGMVVDKASVSCDPVMKKYPCHFCDNVYSGRKACYTHLRMKHGLKLTSEPAPALQPRARRFCHLCNKDFSQKQLLDKHLTRQHGVQVEKRKAFACPLCEERVSYGQHFGQHLLQQHQVRQHVEHLEFPSFEDFLIYKSHVQQQTKCRFRKTTASKQTAEGLRSHYMCSQSGVYVYQGKGIRAAPERQIYKSGRACPAHMLLTQAAGRASLVFYTTHVGHGPCPYYESRDKRTPPAARAVQQEDKEAPESNVNWICEWCGLAFSRWEQFQGHVRAHAETLCPCHYCGRVFQNVEAWSTHLHRRHNVEALF